MELNEKQMTEVPGGVSWRLVSGIASAIVFLIGLFSGYTNPNRCRN